MLDDATNSTPQMGTATSGHRLRLAPLPTLAAALAADLPQRVVLAPCDQPSIQRAWVLSAASNILHVRSDPTLCLAITRALGVHLTDCASTSALLALYDSATGRIMASADDQACVGGDDARTNSTLLAAEMAPCLPLPAETQQFHYHPVTGSLRMKSSNCIATFPGEALDYRDCCLAVAANGQGGD